MNPTGLPQHLNELDQRWVTLLEELREADLKRREALRIFQRAYATAYIEAPFTPSNDSMRKQHAIALTGREAADLETHEAETRFKRDELRALASRVDIARSLYAGIKTGTA